MNNCKLAEGPIFFAHSAPDRPPAAWQKLEDHLLNVANLARSFAEEFSAGEWAYLAGLWHDLNLHRTTRRDAHGSK